MVVKKNIKRSTIEVGRRKSSVARAYICTGKGKIIINTRDYDKYFTFFNLTYKILEPLTLLNCIGKYDVHVNVYGGGINSQAEAVRLAISKCLANDNSEYKTILNSAKLLTRDDRVVESKKAGHKKARKSFQFCKR